MECPNVKINQGDHEGKTALYLAAENDHTQVVMELLKDPSVDVNKGKKEESCRVPDAECNHGAPPIFIASRYGHEAVVRALLADSRLDPNTGLKNNNATPLYIAAQEGHVNVVRALLSHNRTDPNIRRSDGGGGTPLMKAVEKTYTKRRMRYVEIVRLLLQCPKTDHTLKSTSDSSCQCDVLTFARRYGLGLISSDIENRPSLLERGKTC